MEALGSSSSTSGAGGLLGSGGSSGLGSLMGPTGSAAGGDGEQSSERMMQLEREVSTLTNENLKLKELS